MAKKYLDDNGVRYLWTKLKNNAPTKTSDLTNDSGFITSADGGNAAMVNGFKIAVASEPPTNADSNTITFVV